MISTSASGLAFTLRDTSEPWRTDQEYSPRFANRQVVTYRLHACFSTGCPQEDEGERKALASYVKGRRQAKGLTLAAASRKGGLSDTKWREVETGEKNHTAATLAKVAKGLGESPNRVLELGGFDAEGVPATDGDADLEERVRRLEAAVEPLLALFDPTNRIPRGDERPEP